MRTSFRPVGPAALLSAALISLLVACASSSKTDSSASAGQGAEPPTEIAAEDRDSESSREQESRVEPVDEAAHLPAEDAGGPSPDGGSEAERSEKDSVGGEAPEDDPAAGDDPPSGDQAAAEEASRPENPDTILGDEPADDVEESPFGGLPEEDESPAAGPEDPGSESEIIGGDAGVGREAGVKSPEGAPDSPAEPFANPLLVEDTPYAGGEGEDGSTFSGIATNGRDDVAAAGSGSRAIDAPERPDPPVSAAANRAEAANRADSGNNADDTVRTAAASPGPGGDDLRHPAASAEAPDRRLDEPGEITVVLQGQGWVFRSDLSTPGSWRFLDRERDGDSTRFRFEFDETGRWNLVFERQDLSSGGSERTARSVSVGETESAVASAGPGRGTPEHGTGSAEEAAAAGRIGEAIEILEREALVDGPEGRRARSDLMELAAKSGSTAPLVTWLPAYLEDGADPAVLEAALEVLEGNAGYSGESRLILEELSGMERGERTAEWLYKLARSLEEPGEGRDMDRAARLYDEVIRNWPLTDWRDLSEERLAWLQRHYFRVR